MELNLEQLNVIKKKLSQGGNLRDILTKNFPEVSFAVLEEHDYYDHSSWIEAAYFSETQARAVYKPSDGVSLRGQFLTIGTASQIEHSYRFDKQKISQTYLKLRDQVDSCENWLGEQVNLFSQE